LEGYYLNPQGEYFQYPEGAFFGTGMFVRADLANPSVPDTSDTLALLALALIPITLSRRVLQRVCRS
jgi:hypothetical protein